jgi:2-hydroxyacyl-CoA lyase 1
VRFENISLICSSPPTSLLPTIHYERMMQMFGLEGHFCTTVDQIRTAFRAAMAVKDRPSFLNVMISPTASRKAQAFDWLTRSKI